MTCECPAYHSYNGGTNTVLLEYMEYCERHKILLFSQFTSMPDRLEERFQQEQISFYKLTGSTSKEKRLQMVEQFNKDDTTVFCISLKAGGTGLNLTVADIVIHYDLWWNLAVQNQATDWAYRRYIESGS